MHPMTDETNSGPAMPTLEDWQHWTLVMGRAQQMLMEFWAEQHEEGPAVSRHWSPRAFGFGEHRQRQRSDGADDRGRAGLGQGAGDLGQDARRGDRALRSAERPTSRIAASPRRNGARTRSSTPSAKSYLRMSDQLLGSVEEIEGVDRRDAAEAALRDQELRRRDGPVEFRADQPAGAEADASRPAARICSRASPTCSRTLRRAS